MAMISLHDKQKSHNDFSVQIFQKYHSEIIFQLFTAQSFEENILSKRTKNFSLRVQCKLNNT